jgi:transcriptional regulator with XRE-family HTH domain
MDLSPRQLLSFGSTLRAQRQRSNLGLRRLAKMSGLSASYLSRIENDHLPPPSTAVMNRLAHALNTDADVLLTAAGRLPEWITSLLRERPRAIHALITLVAPMQDEEVDALCDELRRERTSKKATIDDNCFVFTKQ